MVTQQLAASSSTDTPALQTQKISAAEILCNAALHDLQCGLYKRVRGCGNDGKKLAAIHFATHFATKKIVERFVKNSLRIRGEFVESLDVLRWFLRKYTQSAGSFCFPASWIVWSFPTAPRIPHAEAIA